MSAVGTVRPVSPVERLGDQLGSTLMTVRGFDGDHRVTPVRFSPGSIYPSLRSDYESVAVVNLRREVWEFCDRHVVGDFAVSEDVAKFCR